MTMTAFVALNKPGGELAGIARPNSDPDHESQNTRSSSERTCRGRALVASSTDQFCKSGRGETDRRAYTQREQEDADIVQKNSDVQFHTIHQIKVSCWQRSI